MKKKIVLCLIVLLLLIPFTSSFATTVDLEMTSEKKELQQGDEVSISVKIKNIPEGKLEWGYQGVLEYDTGIFEEVKVADFVGANGWTASYNETTKQLSEDTTTAADNTLIGTLKLKVKSTVAQDVQTTVKIKDILLSDGDSDITLQKEIIYNIKLNTEEPPNNNNQIGNNTDTVTDVEGKENSTKVNSIGATSDQTTVTTKLPAAGFNMVIILLIIVLIATAVFGIIRYQKIKIK